MTSRKRTEGPADASPAAGREETAKRGRAFPVLLDQERAAEMLAVSPLTLQRWRTCKPPVGPAFVRVGRSVRYRLPDLLAYVDARLVHGSVARGEAL